MKLAEALVLRADIQKKLESLRQRIGKNAVVQEGSKPHEDPAQLMKEAFGVLTELRELVQKINAANTANRLSDGRTLTEAIAQRDELTQQHSLIRHAIDSSGHEPERYGLREIKWVACIEVKKLQKQLEDVSKRIRELNLMIQETNWKTDLG
ncbi:MAG: DIP1984 family protein [Verrucomicrobiales bacterium]|nr:DIP1984 family protein [Verrucomicrobiales bacterium]